MNEQEAINQINQIVENFEKKVADARAQYRLEINTILKNINNRHIEEARKKLEEIN